MTPLDRLLRTRIKLNGPITLADYMAECLGHPKHGYYMNRDPFGAAGDFITAPEVSQMFGELLGLWCADYWEQIGGPDPVRLVELGPGRGTLMADALRAANAMPEFRQAVDVHLVETSPALRAQQSDRLADATPTWHDRLDDVPGGPALIIANEFFDALPVHQLQFTEAGWRERLVALDAEGDALCQVLAPTPTPAEALIPIRLRDQTPPVGSVVEVSPAAVALARALSERLVADGGAALVIDYGRSWSAPGETLQAVRGHRSHPILTDPGTADMTAHVDFGTLVRAAVEAGAASHGPVPQGLFLCTLGLETRAETLAANATPEQTRDIEQACRRLIGTQEMGTLFKVLALTRPDLPIPAGFPTK